VFVLTRETWADVMDGQPPAELWGIGAKTAAKLEALGVRTVAELARADPEVLAGRFGPRTGPWLARLARGEGSAEVHPEGWVARGRGREHTFQQNLTDADEIASEVRRLAREVARDLGHERRRAVRVVVKVRFAPFFTNTHGVPVAEPTDDPDAIAQAAERALAKFELGRPVRLLGVRAELQDPG
jgi:DNA polymerase-4